MLKGLNSEALLKVWTDIRIDVLNFGSIKTTYTLKVCLRVKVIKHQAYFWLVYIFLQATFSRKLQWSLLHFRCLDSSEKCWALLKGQSWNSRPVSIVPDFFPDTLCSAKHLHYSYFLSQSINFNTFISYSFRVLFLELLPHFLRNKL